MASDFAFITDYLNPAPDRRRGMARRPLTGVRKVIAEQAAMFKDGESIEDIYKFVAFEAAYMNSALLHVYALNICCQMHENDEPCFTRAAQHADAIKKLVQGGTLHADREALANCSLESRAQIELYCRNTRRRTGRNQLQTATNMVFQTETALGMVDRPLPALPKAPAPRKRAAVFDNGMHADS